MDDQTESPRLGWIKRDFGESVLADDLRFGLRDDFSPRLIKVEENRLSRHSDPAFIPQSFDSESVQILKLPGKSHFQNWYFQPFRIVEIHMSSMRMDHGLDRRFVRR